VAKRPLQQRAVLLEGAERRRASGREPGQEFPQSDCRANGKLAARPTMMRAVSHRGSSAKLDFRPGSRLRISEVWQMCDSEVAPRPRSDRPICWAALIARSVCSDSFVPRSGWPIRSTGGSRDRLPLVGCAVQQADFSFLITKFSPPPMADRKKSGPPPWRTETVAESDRRAAGGSLARLHKASTHAW
jgi:hypothetical protein